ncbi:MAG: hypothetical protein IPO81_23010, partial [Kouleothrix sp.]|nr:hypothetical protein [Kouleothrix sp.]
METDGPFGHENFERYVQALQSPTIHYPLTDAQATILRTLYRNRRASRIRNLEDRFAVVDFASIGQDEKFAGLVQELREHTGPAFIMDDLWFIHAVNGAQLKLFTVDPRSSPFLRRWDGWRH